MMGAEVGKMSALTSGQSYMPAVVVPIPIIAPVQDTACDSSAPNYCSICLPGRVMNDSSLALLHRPDRRLRWFIDGYRRWAAC